MKYRTLGKIKEPLSAIGFGAWGIGKKWWGPTEDRESIAALQAAWDTGVNFFDTAYVYGDGHSEQLIQKALPEKKAFVATKIPPKNNEWPPTDKTRFEDAFPRDWIESCTERSLKNLGRDTLDLTQFHVWSDRWLEQGAPEAIGRLKASGKIQAFGVSINDHDPDSALKLVASGLVDSVQVIFNIFDQSPTNKLFPLCEIHRVGVIARVPFDEGGLTGTFNPKTTFPQGDFRGQYFKGRNLTETLERAGKLSEFLDEDTPNLPSLALKFILGHAAVSTVIPGMRTWGHVKQNTAVVEQKPLRSEIMEKLKRHAWPKNFYTWWKD